MSWRLQLSYLTGLLFMCPVSSAMIYFGFKVAATAVVPPDLLGRLGCIVSRGALVALIVPLSSHLWKQGLERVALASLQPHAAWATRCLTQNGTEDVGNHCLPGVWEALETLVTNPMGFLLAATA